MYSNKKWLKNLMNISIILPCFNEERNVIPVYQNIIDCISATIDQYEIIFVNDGSTDKTMDEIDKACYANNSVKVINLERNMGYGFAVRKGLENARYEYIFYIDCDRQFDFKEYNKMLAYLQSGYDLVGGMRLKRCDKKWREILANFGQAIFKNLFKVNYINDINCGFKGIKKEALKKINLTSTSAITFSVDIYLECVKKKVRFIQIPVEHFRREYGNSKGVNLKQYICACYDIAFNIPKWFGFIFNSDKNYN